MYFAVKTKERFYSTPLGLLLCLFITPDYVLRCTADLSGVIPKWNYK